MESVNSSPDQHSRMPSPAARPILTRSSPPSSKCAAGSLPWARRSVRRKKRVPLSRRKVLHGLADGDARGSPAARLQLGRDEVGLLLAGLAEHPADRLTNEELPLVEHLVRITAEPLEVADAATQRWQQRQQRRTSHPEIRVRRPAIENGK